MRRRMELCTCQSVILLFWTAILWIILKGRPGWVLLMFWRVVILQMLMSLMIMDCLRMHLVMMWLDPTSWRSIFIAFGGVWRIWGIIIIMSILYFLLTAGDIACFDLLNWRNCIVSSSSPYITDNIFVAQKLHWTFKKLWLPNIK